MTQPETKLVAKVSCVVAWSMGVATLEQGKPFEGQLGALLMAERPDLFVLPSSHIPVITPPAAQCWYWKCKSSFEPHSPMQRYCSVDCRRQRENELKKAVRLVTKKNYPPIPQKWGPGAKDRCYAHQLEVEGLVALVGSLIMHLGGRLWIGPPPEVDEVVLPLSNKAALLDLAQRAYMDLMELRNQSVRAVGEASRNQVREDEVSGATAAARFLADKAKRIFSQWDDQLDRMDESEDEAALKTIH